MVIEETVTATPTGSHGPDVFGLSIDGGRSVSDGVTVRPLSIIHCLTDAECLASDDPWSGTAGSPWNGRFTGIAHPSFVVGLPFASSRTVSPWMTKKTGSSSFDGDPAPSDIGSSLSEIEAVLSEESGSTEALSAAVLVAFSVTHSSTAALWRANEFSVTTVMLGMGEGRFSSEVLLDAALLAFSTTHSSTAALWRAKEYPEATATGMPSTALIVGATTTNGLTASTTICASSARPRRLDFLLLASTNTSAPTAPTSDAQMRLASQ
ncbi:hypothetical protein D9M68_174290 [compost metagenome]